MFRYAVVAAAAVATFSGGYKGLEFAFADAGAAGATGETVRVGDDFGSYRPVEFAWIGQEAGGAFVVRQEARIKVVEQGGKLAVCGFVLKRNGRLADRSAVYIAGSDLQIGDVTVPAKFVRAQEATGSDRDAEATCIVTRERWSPKLADAPIAFRLPS